MKRFLPIVALLACVAAAPRVELVRDTIIDERGLYLPDGRWGHTLNGRSFQQDAVANFAGHQYAIHFDGDRRLCIARRRIGDTTWEVIRFDDYRFKGNDTHNAPVLGICRADGTIHLSFDHHGHPLHYRVSKPGVATNPGDVKWESSLFGATTDQLEPGKKIARVTYPRFISTPAGDLQFQCRIGASGDGAAHLADYRDGRWQNFAPFISGVGAYNGGTSRNAYENSYTYDANGRLHVTWCWRETGDPHTNHDLCYAYSDDAGVTWLNNAGEPIGRRGEKLITIESPGVRVWETPTHRGLINSTTQAIDSQRRLHVITRQLPDGVSSPRVWDETLPLTRFHHFWRDPSGQWHRIPTDLAGNRGQLCFDADDNAYHIFVNDGGLQIAAASAAGEWRDWKIIHTDDRPFTDQPLIAQEATTLSIYVQQAPPDPSLTSAPLRVLDFRLQAQP